MNLSKLIEKLKNNLNLIEGENITKTASKIFKQ